MSAEYLLINKEPVIPFADFSLELGTYVVGRSTGCDLPVYDLTISRQHARLEVSKKSIRITDLNSRNGTFLNGKQIQSGTAEPGMEIRFGRVLFVVARQSESSLADALVEVDTVRHSSGEAPAPQPGANRTLTTSQLRVLGYLLEGYTEKQIAEELKLSPHTVHNHIRDIYAALNVHSRAQLLSKFIPDKNLDGEDPPVIV